ncbi:hypothetical protein [Streptomyces sp. SPB162]|uniref:hypothetical protein n=1 Tax=Streptomyces sp. SPB162 TaxID=2940560 RepID=UPI0024057D87|nr:hypothetical protein [Streptomyces sp. SPB162]MDF9814932.1 hypothetical protein [Streptomyces sp. SPB162]
MQIADLTLSSRIPRRPALLPFLPALLVVVLGTGGCSDGSGSPGSSGSAKDGKPGVSDSATGGAMPPAFLAAMRQETKCMREHGITDYPDPSPTNGEFTYPAALGLRLKEDPATAAIWHTCQAKFGGDGIQGG